MKRQIFLDLDGPLLDNRDKYFHLVKTLLHGETGVITQASYWEQKCARKSEAEILKPLALSDEALQDYNRQRIASIEHFEYLKHDKVWPWVPDLLTRWKQENELFIVTMRKRRESLMQELDYLGLIPFFHHILNKDQNSGDAPVKVDLVKPFRRDLPGIFVGDTEADIRAGKTLGLETFAVTCGIRNEAWLRKEAPDHLVPDLRDVARILQERD